MKTGPQRLKGYFKCRGVKKRKKYAKQVLRLLRRESNLHASRGLGTDVFTHYKVHVKQSAEGELEHLCSLSDSYPSNLFNAFYCEKLKQP